MKHQIVWSKYAEGQLDEIFAYYNKKAGYKIAKNLITEIINGTKILEENPLLGPIEELLIGRNEDYHYLVKGNYKVIYSVDNSNKLVKIADVFDTRQNPTKISKGK